MFDSRKPTKPPIWNNLSGKRVLSAMRAPNLLVLLVLASLSLSAWATPDILKQFKAIYNKPNITCAECHTKPPQRNAFGKDVEAALDKTSDGMLTKEVMQTIEKLDSDKDGYSNIDEINAGTLPGDPNSKPTAGTSPADGNSGTTGTVAKSDLIPKHSFHPALVHFPIALLAIAAFLELLFLRNKNSVYHSASVINLAIGLVCSAGTIATGIAAWLRLGYEIKGDLLIHLILASSSVIVGIIAYTQRDKPKPYLAIVLVSGLLVMVAGHFGGNLVYG